MPFGKNHIYFKIFETLMGALSTQNQGSEVDTSIRNKPWTLATVNKSRSWKYKNNNYITT
jgi:hypothetical protein